MIDMITQGDGASGGQPQGLSEQAAAAEAAPPQGVLVFSHGTLLCGGAAAVQAVTAQVQQRLGEAYCCRLGFLNYCSPTVEEAVGELLAAGCRTIRVVPFFLIDGKFLREDLARCLEGLRGANLEIAWEVVPPLAADPGRLHAWIEDLAQAAGEFEPAVAALQHEAARRCERRPGQCPAWRPATLPRCLLSGLSQQDGVSATAAAAVAGVDRSPGSACGGAAGAAALLIIIHGSPHPGAQRPFYEAAVRARAAGPWALVLVAHLDCNGPDIPTAVRLASEFGCTRLVLVPMFLHPARHVVLDVPAAISEGIRQSAAPLHSVRLAPWAGRHSTVAAALAQAAGRRCPGEVAQQQEATRTPRL